MSYPAYVPIRYMSTDIGTYSNIKWTKNGRNLISKLSIDNYWVRVYIANPIVRMKTQPRIR